MANTIQTVIKSYILAILVIGCNTGNEDLNNPSDAVTTNEAPEDFQQFYISFHTDTNFQLSHITFPLQGLPSADTTFRDYSEFKWEKKDWKWHSLNHFDPDLYEVERNVIDSTLVTEIIREKTSGMGIKRRFAKFNDEWFLIYYSGMNPVP